MCLEIILQKRHSFLEATVFCRTLIQGKKSELSIFETTAAGVDIDQLSWFRWRIVDVVIDKLLLSSLDLESEFWRMIMNAFRVSLKP